MKFISYIRHHIDFGIAALFGCIISCINSIDVIVYAFKRPSNTIYIGISHWYQDYFYYLSLITQSIQGEWLIHNAYTTEYIKPSLIWWYYIALGKIASIVHLSPWTAFNSSVFLLAILYVTVMYAVIKRIYPSNVLLRTGAMIIAITSTNFFTISVNNGIHITPIEFFYDYTDAFNRIGGVSHLIFQNIISLLLLWVYSSIVEQKNQINFGKKLFCISILAISLFIVSPVFFFSDICIMIITACIYSLLCRNKKLLVYFWLPVMLCGIVTAPLYLIQSNAFTDPFYMYMREWEMAIPKISFTTLIASTGTIILFCILGLPTYIKRISPLRCIGLLLIIIPLATYFSSVPEFIGLPPFRFMQPAAYIFLGIIAIEGIEYSSILFSRFAKKSHIIIFVTLLYVGIQLPVLYIRLQKKLHEYYLQSSLNYVPQDIFTGISELTHLSQAGNVLATNNMEILVPPISGRTVYSGHQSLTYNYTQKITTVFQFYQHIMSPSDAHTFLKTNKISFVLWNKNDGDNFLTESYPFLSKIYQNASIEIYAVNE